MRELRNDTTRIVAAVRAGERVVLTVHGEPVADIVPHVRRTAWLSGPDLAAQLATRSADSGLSDELADLSGQTLDEMIDRL